MNEIYLPNLSHFTKSFLFLTDEENCQSFRCSAEESLDLYVNRANEIMDAAHPQVDLTSLLQFVQSVTQFKEMTGDHWPFHPEFLRKWLDFQEYEMELFRKMASLDGVVFMTEKDRLKEELAKCQLALVLYIPPLEDWSRNISSAMLNYVRSPFPKSAEHDELPWHAIEDKRNLILSKMAEFENHVRINRDVVKYFVAYKSKRFGCSFTIYKAGQVVKNQLLQLPGPPSNLRVKTFETESSIRLFRVDWNYVELYDPKFIVECRKGSKTWTKETDTSSIHLKYEKELEVRVAMETDVGRSEFSRVFSLADPGASVKLEPDIRIAEVLAKRWIKIGEEKGRDLIAVPLTKSVTSSAFQRFVFDGEKGGDNRTILLVGGAVKTLLNSMANFIFGVELEDRFRFQLMEDDQTEITVYDIRHVQGSRVPFSLTIVDIPNCEPEMFRKFLNDNDGIRKLDAVGMVSQADSILSLFGKDLKEDVCYFLSPSSVGKVRFPVYELNGAGIENFFADLKTKRGKSLEMTRQVLEDGRRLTSMVEELQSSISNIKKNSEIREKTRQVIADCQSQMDAIKELKIPQEMEVTDGENAINCAVCDVSCYFAPEVKEEPNCSTCHCGKEVHFGSKTYKWTESVARDITPDNHEKYVEELMKKQLAEEDLLKMERDGEEFRRESLERERAVSLGIQQLETIALHPFFTPQESIVKSERLEICKIIEKIKKRESLIDF